MHAVSEISDLEPALLNKSAKTTNVDSIEGLA